MAAALTGRWSGNAALLSLQKTPLIGFPGLPHVAATGRLGG